MYLLKCINLTHTLLKSKVVSGNIT